MSSFLEESWPYVSAMCLKLSTSININATFSLVSCARERLHSELFQKRRIFIQTRVVTRPYEDANFLHTAGLYRTYNTAKSANACNGRISSSEKIPFFRLGLYISRVRHLWLKSEHTGTNRTELPAAVRLPVPVDACSVRSRPDDRCGSIKVFR